MDTGLTTGAPFSTLISPLILTRRSGGGLGSARTDGARVESCTCGFCGLLRFEARSKLSDNNPAPELLKSLDSESGTKPGNSLDTGSAGGIKEPGA